MLRAIALFFLFSGPALACDGPVCEVPPDSLSMTRIITFDDQPSSWGVGREVTGILVQPGASFGERFLGQDTVAVHGFDRIIGMPVAPLVLLEGGPGQNLGIMRLYSTSVLHGHGPVGFPEPEAVGEGAIAVLFDRDQTALGFDVLGGENGTLDVTFLRRDGSLLQVIRLVELTERSFVFLRRGSVPDIAAIILINDDPEGLAIDNLRFEFEELMGALPDLARPRG